MSAPPLPRLDGAAVWDELTPEAKAEIGAIAIELVGGWACQDAMFERVIEPSDDPVRAWERAASHFDGGTTLIEALQDVLAQALPRESFFDGPTPRLPSRWDRICRACGCSNHDGCEGGCSWVGSDLCSACAEARR